MKANSLIIITHSFEDEETGAESEIVLSVCSKWDYYKEYLKTMENVRGRKIAIEMDRTQYFRQFRYCKECDESRFDVSSNLAYVMEVSHRNEHDTEAEWHFDSLMPLNIASGWNAIFPIEDETRRFYTVCLPYPVNTIMANIPTEKRQRTKNNPVSNVELTQRMQVIADSVNQIRIIFMACLLFYVLA